MVNRSEILRSAWVSYRRDVFKGWGVRRDGPFSRSHFAYCLRMAWAEAKAAAAPAVEATAQAFASAQARVMAAKAAAMPEGERSARISELRDELTVLDYAPLGVRTMNRRRDLNAQLAAFTA